MEMRAKAFFAVAVMLLATSQADITTEISRVLGGSPVKHSISDILLSFNESSPYRNSEMKTIVDKLTEFAERLVVEDRQHWQDTHDAVVRDNVTVFEKESQVVMLQTDIDHEETKLEMRVKAHDRELALLETIHRQLGTRFAAETAGAVEARDAKTEAAAAGAAATAPAPAAGAGHKAGGGFHRDNGTAAKVAAYLDAFAKRVLAQEAEDRQSFETFRRETNEQQAQLRTEAEQLKEKIAMEYATYRKAKEERDQQIGLVGDVKVMIAEDAAKTDAQRGAEDRARGGEAWWNKYIKEADAAEVKRNSKYVSNTFTAVPTGWRPWTDAPVSA